MSDTPESFAAALPKAELHLHIEGTLEPEMMLALAARNRVALRYRDAAEIRRAHEYTDLQSFLDLYYEATSVLRTELDFYELTDAYLRRARAAGVLHAEIFFDPQAHLVRGVAFEAVIDGLWEAVRGSERNYGITSSLIMCFLRDRSAEEAMTVIERARPFGDRIVAVGLDSAEVGNPPQKFAHVFERARAEGWRAVAHAGEEGPPEFVTATLDLLRAERIDHGIRSLEDSRLVARLRDERIALTVCPFSNVKLRVVDRLEDHPLRKMMEAGLAATINSDDPAYFGGYVDRNYSDTAQALSLTPAEMIGLARNSFDAAFLTSETRREYLTRLDVYSQHAEHLSGGLHGNGDAGARSADDLIR